MDDTLARIWPDLLGRTAGPLSMRVWLQPSMASLFAIRDGSSDASAGCSPYLWTLFTHAEERRWMLADGWKSIAKIVILAIVLDVAYQQIVFHRIYPGEVLDVALLLAVIPYCLLRGLANRLVRRRKARVNPIVKH
jgi:hypothetical protein